MKKLSIIGSTVLLMAVAISCAPQVAPPPAAAPQAPADSAGQKQGWQAQWDSTLAAARKEGRVVLFTTAGADIRAAFTKVIKEKYDIEMDYVTGKGVEMITKILAERRAGLFNADAYMAGSTSTMSMLVPEGVIDVMTGEYILPDVSDTSKWYGNKLPYIDTETRILGFRGSIFWPYTINTTLVKPEEVASFRDLLKPAFKGKIAMADPTIEGASNSFVTLASGYLLDREYIRALIRQEPFLSRDERLVTEWVARGKYSILIGTKPDPITEFRKAGAPLMSIIPKEGSMIEPGAGSISVVTRRPHPAATRIFINWLLSKEGQTLYAELAGIESAREDVSKAHLPPGLVREPGKKYIFGDDAFRQVADKVVQQSKEDFKPLLK